MEERIAARFAPLLEISNTLFAQSNALSRTFNSQSAAQAAAVDDIVPAIRTEITESETRVRDANVLTHVAEQKMADIGAYSAHRCVVLTLNLTTFVHPVPAQPPSSPRLSLFSQLFHWLSSSPSPLQAEQLPLLPRKAHQE